MSVVNLKYSKWVFKDTIDFTGFEDFNFEIEFVSYNATDGYNSFFNRLVGSVEENKLFFNTYYEFDNNPLREHNAYNGTTWLNEKCKTIVFADGKDKTNKELIAFLEKNATLITKVSNLKNSKWLLNEILDDYYYDEALHIKSNNQEFNYVYREDSYGLEYYNENDETIMVYDEENGWVNQAYRTIEVLDCETLKYIGTYSWLMNNATLLEEQPIALKEYLTDIANAIRETGCLTEKINGQDIASEIKKIRTLKKLLDSTKSTRYLFENCNFTRVENVISYNDTENVEDFSDTFNNNTNITTIPLLNMSKAISAQSMFSWCESIREIPPFDFSNVQNMNSTFRYCKRLQTINLNNSNATDMQGMFYSCYKLSKIDITKLTETQNSQCFYGCRSLTKLIIRTMDTIPTIGSNMFADCCHLLGTQNDAYNPDGLKDGRIYVPDDKVEELKAATNWSDLADIIVPLSTLEE